jgi:hypothetical protein
MRDFIIRALLSTLWALAGWIGAVHATSGEITPEAIPVCYNFGCSVKETIGITPGEWKQVTNWFSKPAGNAEQERTQIKKAVGWLEVIVGRYTPIYRDLGQDDLSQGRLGQMDCIDEEKNVTAFLQLFQNQGLLRFHRVTEPAYRRTAWNQHWAGQIAEIESRQKWVVDSWFQSYGNNPYIQESEQWSDIPFIFASSYTDNSPD